MIVFLREQKRRGQIKDKRLRTLDWLWTDRAQFGAIYCLDRCDHLEEGWQAERRHWPGRGRHSFWKTQAWPTLTWCWEEKTIPSVWTQFNYFLSLDFHHLFPYQAVSSIRILSFSTEVGDTWPNLELLLLTLKLLCFCSTVLIMNYKC